MTSTKKPVKNMALCLGHHGVWATVSALNKFIHPSEHICIKFLYLCAGQCLLDCKTICQEVKTVSRMEQLMLVVHHEDFKIDDVTYIELYAVKRSQRKAIWTAFWMNRLLLLKKKSMMNRGCSQMPLEFT